MSNITFVCNPNSAVYYQRGPAMAFESQGARVVWDDEWDHPPGVILWGGEPVAYLTFHDFGITDYDVGVMRRYPLRLFLHLCPTLGERGEEFASIAKAAGYYAPLNTAYQRDEGAAWGDRDVGIMARMRTHQFRPDRAGLAWSQERAAIVKEAESVPEAVTGKVSPPDYMAELLRTKVGVNWRGICPINFRVIEYLSNGVCMVSDRLDFDVRDGVRLEDGVHYVAAESGADAVRQARELLADDERARRIAEAGRTFWETYLAPEKLGAWYVEQIEAVT